MKSNISMYTDDHQFFEASKDVQLIQTRLQESAVAATSWYKENCLQGNFTKYGSMLISKQKDANINIDIDGNRVSHYQNIKLLGVRIDSQLTFNVHISEICKKASQRVGVMIRLRNLIPTTAKLQLYKAAVLPYLTYCSTVWHFCRGSDARKVEHVQERGLRAVFRDWNANYRQLLEWAKLPTLVNRRLQDIATIMYKVKFKLAPSYIQDLFSANHTVYNLRVKEFTIPRFNSINYGRHSLRYLGPVLWAKLPSRIRTLNSLAGFKRAVRGMDLKMLMDDGGCVGCLVCSA